MNTRMFSVGCRGLLKLTNKSFLSVVIPHRSLLRASSKSNTGNKRIIGLIPVIIPSIAALSEEKSKPDQVQDNKDDVENHEVDDQGWERVCAVFRKDEFGNLSKGLTATIQSTSMACVIGLIFGGVQSSKIAFIDYMERNQATIFENHLDAKRKLQNHVTIHFGKGALRWACKLSAFTGGFVLCLTLLSAYKGKTSVLDYTMGASLVGALVRLQVGPRAMVIGGILGGILGTLCGLTTTGLLTYTGTSLDEVISYQYEVDHGRQKLFQDILTTHFENQEGNKEAMELLKHREHIQKEKDLLTLKT